MAELRKYNASGPIYFPLVEAGGQDFITSASFVAGDSQYRIAGGSFANTTNLPSHLGNGIYSISLTASELQGDYIVVTIVDQTSTKVWEDQAIIIETYGNASAALAFDLDTATQSVNATQISGSTTAADNVEANIGNLDAAVSGRSSHSAADVWSAGTRTLTSFGTLIADIWSYVTRTLTANTNLNDPTAGAIADAVWDEATGGHTAGGSFGEEVQSHSTTSELNARTLPSADYFDPAADTVATVTSVTNQVSANVIAISGDSGAADTLKLSVNTILAGNAVTGTLSTTQMTTDVSETTNDHFIGRVIIWTSGALQYQATDITDYDGATNMFTFSAVTEAPSNGDSFIIV